jgi:hypothetical protein
VSGPKRGHSADGFSQLGLVVGNLRPEGHHLVHAVVLALLVVGPGGVKLRAMIKLAAPAKVR